MISQCTDYAPDEEHGRYLVWCQERVRKYPVVQERYWDAERVNPYCFMSVLFDRLEEDDIVVTGDGTACVVAMQAACIKPGQRLYTNSGCASMGYDLPAAIGAAIARYGQKIICIAGDGSIMMNLQELQTIVGLGLPIKIFILNNEGYHSIRQTQNAYFPGNEVGVGPKSGLTFPNFTRIANAFGLVATRIESTNELAGQVASVLNGDGPIVCEVMLDLDQGFEPKLASRRLEDGTMVSPSLEDMAPFLSREELRQNML
jgi:acetolactate synthase-1/2/3 large subunit